jgi:hypothetical protein
MKLDLYEELDDLISTGVDISEENSKIISLEVSTSGNSSAAVSLIEFVGSHPEITRSISFYAEYEDDRPPTNLVYLNRDTLQVPDLTTSPEWYQEYRKSASFYLQESAYDELIEHVEDVVEPETNQITLKSSIKKDAIEESTVEKNTSSLNEDQINIQLWSSPDNFRNWLSRKNVSELTKILIRESSVPIIIFLQELESPYLETTIPLVAYQDLSNFDWSNLVNIRERYLKEQSVANDLFEFSGLSPVVSPSLFDSGFHRNLFSKLFIYGFAGALSERCIQTGESLDIEISGTKRILEDTINPSTYELTSDEANTFFQCYDKFAKKADREIYRELWYESIVEHCTDLKDIAHSYDSILHHYEALEQNAIEGNFEQLSGAVQDAQIFIGDVTNTLSSRTVGLTTEIQKVVLALFGVIAGNLFLLVRDATLRLVIPFTMILVSGLVLLYFPTAQSRISEVSNIIQEGKNDADVYSDLAESVGAGQLVDRTCLTRGRNSGHSLSS